MRSYAFAVLPPPLASVNQGNNAIYKKRAPTKQPNQIIGQVLLQQCLPLHTWPTVGELCVSSSQLSYNTGMHASAGP